MTLLNDLSISITFQQSNDNKYYLKDEYTANCIDFHILFHSRNDFIILQKSVAEFLFIHILWQAGVLFTFLIFLPEVLLR